MLLLLLLARLRAERDYFWMQGTHACRVAIEVRMVEEEEEEEDQDGIWKS